MDKVPKALYCNGFGPVFYQQGPWTNGVKAACLSTWHMESTVFDEGSQFFNTLAEGEIIVHFLGDLVASVHDGGMIPAAE